jgi:outer membrane protein TolC
MRIHSWHPPRTPCIGRAAAVLTGLAITVHSASVAAAQQPLAAFLRAAEEQSLDAREAALRLALARENAGEARARLLPTLRAAGATLRNEQEISATLPTAEGSAPKRVVFRPRDQHEVTVSLSLPVLDPGATAALRSARAEVEAEAAIFESGRNLLRERVILAWYDLAAARATLGVATDAVRVADEIVAEVERRIQGGAAVGADRLRAAADAATARQLLVESETGVALASRDLAVLSGLVLSTDEQELEDSLSSEAPLEHWLAHADRLPEVRAAGSRIRSAAWQQRARIHEMLPVLSLVLEERRSNAVGFGRASSWAVGLGARWEVGFGSTAAQSTARTRHALAAARAERVRIAGETGILRAWHGVKERLERAGAARLGEAAMRAAADMERLRFTEGVATLRQRNEADLDLMRASAARIRADADLLASRAILRLRAGLGLEQAPSGPQP